jgi:NMD protein affecting ribosome stability and mRNA decay
MSELRGNLLNKEGVERGQEELRVPIRPIFCMNCGNRIPPLAYNLADEGYVEEDKVKNILNVTVCKECVKDYAEEPEGGWWVNHVKIAKEQVDSIIDMVLKQYGVETIEELNDDIGSDDVIEHKIANKLVEVLDTLDKVVFD